MKLLSMCIQFKLPNDYDQGVPEALRLLANHLEQGGSGDIVCTPSTFDNAFTNLDAAWDDLTKNERVLSGSIGLNEWSNECDWRPLTTGMRVRPQLKIVGKE